MKSRAVERALDAFVEKHRWKDAFDLTKSEWVNNHDYRIVDYFREKVRHNITEKSLEYYRMSYDLTARDVFDDFMLALEWNREAEKQFWLPRRHKLLPICNALQDLEDGRLDELFLSQPPRTGKALADDTPILTKDGWKNHGDLVVGDEVIGMNGEFKKVTHVHPKCQLDVLMEFTNGEKIQCHENHEWLFHDRARGSERLEETKYYERQKIESGEPGKRGHRYRFQLPKRDYVQGIKKDLPLDPYTLGVWLGDGNRYNPTICNAPSDNAIIKKILFNGEPISWHTVHKTTGVDYYGFKFRESLKKFDMCHSRRRMPKYIPDEYLTASVEQRLELLAGLIDTDGAYTRKEHRYHFTTCEESLLNSFVQLISTFGWRTCVTVAKPILSSSGVQGRHDTYTVGFNPDCEIPCALERKQNHEFSKRRAIALKSITRVEPKQGNCITVEGDGMYLAGNTMIPTHNTTLILMFTLWLMFRDSDRANLYSSFSDTVVKVYYNGILEVLGDPDTYRWKELFPTASVASTNAKENLIDIDRTKHYASLTCRSLYGTLNGACDVSENGILIADDLHSGIEEALNKALLDKAWMRVTNNLIPRAKETARILWIGTRWSLHDCISRRIDILQNDPEWKDRKYLVMNVPALNEFEQSNFDYLYNKGFSAEHYKRIRSQFERSDDIASWDAQYMGEPIERSGTLFEPSAMRYYNGILPDGEPDSIYMPVDPAWGGGDFVSAPVFVEYDGLIYIPAVVFNNGDKRVTIPKIAKTVVDNNVSMVYCEGTKVTSSYGDELDAQIKKRGHKCNLQNTTKHWSGLLGKAGRIYKWAPEIRDRIIFLDKAHRDKEYNAFMNNLFQFTIEGKVKHDDAPDSLAMGLEMKNNYVKAEIYQRPF